MQKESQPTFQFILKHKLGLANGKRTISQKPMTFPLHLHAKIYQLLTKKVRTTSINILSFMVIIRKQLPPRC